MIMFVFSLCLLMFSYGFISYRNHIFPYHFISKAYQGAKSFMPKNRGYNKWFYVETKHSEVIPTYDREKVFAGNSLVTGLGSGDKMIARVIDMDGHVIHEWNVGWFDVWENTDHLIYAEIPKANPGTHIHGAIVLDDGGIIYNYEHLGLVRLNACGDVVWRLPYRTHHSIYKDKNDILWISGRILHNYTGEPEEKNHVAGYPLLMLPMYEESVLKVSLEGEILEEILLFDLLLENDLQSLLYMSSVANNKASVIGDIMHLNDVEPFPIGMEPGVFGPGDIMISLRNSNSIIIFNEKSRKVKQLSIGGFFRQHDPDFVDGNTISIFDNNNIGPFGGPQHSRILIKSFNPDSTYIHYTGSQDESFFTDVMGKHQWLPNGNMLITEGAAGRAFEIDSTGKIVWEYVNLAGESHAGIIEEVQRLPEHFTKSYFEKQMENCK